MYRVNKHTELTGGGAVKAAGKLMISGGNILLNNESGRYRFQPTSAVNNVRTLLRILDKTVDVIGGLL